MTGRPTDADINRALDQAGVLSGRAMSLAVALDELIGIDLPPGADSHIDQAQMRAIASLYLAADLEGAGVLPAVETLAGLARTGAVPVDLGPATPLLQAFWKNRNDRASPAERAAFFARLFGGQTGPAPTGPVNAEFEDRMVDMCEALYKMDEQAVNPTYGGTAQQARVRAAAQALASNLVHAGGGVTAFLAQEVLQALRDALAILAVPQLRAAFHAIDAWGAIGGIDRLAGIQAADPGRYARRGKAGMTVLSWLADAGELLDQPAQPLVGLDHPVIGAAVDWLQASLSIGEATSPSPPTPTYGPVPTPASGSPWAAIGA